MRCSSAAPLLGSECEGQVGWNLNFLLTGVSGGLGGLCVCMSKWEGSAGSSGTEGAADLRLRKKGKKPHLRSWECSRPCRRGICIHPSRPRRPAGHCVWRSNLCHCCRASWCARCEPLGRTGGLPYCRHIATPRKWQRRREDGFQLNVSSPCCFSSHAVRMKEDGLF